LFSTKMSFTTDYRDVHNCQEKTQCFARIESLEAFINCGIPMMRYSPLPPKCRRIYKTKSFAIEAVLLVLSVLIALLHEEQIRAAGMTLTESLLIIHHNCAVVLPSDL